MQRVSTSYTAAESIYRWAGVASVRLTATAQPTSTPPAAATAQPGPDSRVPDVPDSNQGGVAALICSYAWDCGTALRVFTCESGLNPGVRTNPLHSGLAQIAVEWHIDKVESVVGRQLTWSEAYEALLDVNVNLAVAWIIYADSGWGPWECP